MAGLDPAIHVLRTAAAEDGDPRDKAGDDGCGCKDRLRLVE